MVVNGHLRAADANRASTNRCLCGRANDAPSSQRGLIVPAYVSAVSSPTLRRLRLAGVASGEPSARPRPLAWLGIGGLLATSFLICLSATSSELLLPSTLRPLPAWLAGPFDGLGLELGPTAVIAAFVLMFFAVVLIWLLRKVWIGEHRRSHQRLTPRS